MRRLLHIAGLSTLFFIIFLITGGINQENPSHEHAPVITPDFPDSMYFCGERVPLEYFDIYESLERELIVNTYFHSQTITLLKKSARYFPVIEPILAARNIPEDFKYLAVAESGLAHVVSPAGARGFWQILEGTARDYKLEVNDYVDERYHLEKSTVAACEYLQDSYEKYQNWTLVAASYNVGRRGINRQIDRQGEQDYYDLLLNEETARYVFRILAIKQIFEHPEEYGFQISEADYYQPRPYWMDTLRKPIDNIAEYAKANNTNYKILKFLNPWLRDNSLPNASGKEYLIKIPETRLKNTCN